MLLGTPLLSVLLRYGLPPLSAWLRQCFGLDLAPHHGFILGVLLVVDVPMNAGAVLALLVLDERDDRTLSALAVTRSAWAATCGTGWTTAAALGCLLPALSLPLTGLVPAVDLVRAAPALLPAALVAALAGTARTAVLLVALTGALRRRLGRT